MVRYILKQDFNYKFVNHNDVFRIISNPYRYFVHHTSDGIIKHLEGKLCNFAYRSRRNICLTENQYGEIKLLDMGDLLFETLSCHYKENNRYIANEFMWVYCGTKMSFNSVYEIEKEDYKPRVVDESPFGDFVGSLVTCEEYYERSC